MVDVGVSVVLVVGVNLLISSAFLISDRVSLMPRAHVILHPLLHFPLVDARLITAAPDSVVSRRQVEVGAGKVSLEIVRQLEASACVASTSALAQLGVVSTSVRDSALLDIAEGVVGTQAVHFTITRVQLEEVGLRTIACGEAAEP